MPREMKENGEAIAKLVVRPALAMDVGDFVTSLAFSPEGRHFGGTTGSGGVFLSDIDGKDPITVDVHRGGSQASAWSKDGQHWATGGNDGALCLWDVGSRKVTIRLELGAWVEHIAWHPKRDVLAASAGKRLLFFSPEGRVLQEVATFKNTISGIDWHEGLDSLVAVGYSSVQFWRVGETQPWKTFELQGSLLSVKWSPDGSHIACACQDNSVHIWIMKTGEDLEMSGYPVKIRSLDWSPTSRFLATAGGPDVTVWDFSGKGPAGSKPKGVKGHTDLVTSVEFHRSLPLFATGGIDGATLIFDGKLGKMPLAVGIHEGAVSKVAWHPTKPVLLSGYESGHVFAWNVESRVKR